jgi:hypothetical protein
VHIGLESQAAPESSNRIKGPVDLLQSRGCNLGARGWYAHGVQNLLRTKHQYSIEKPQEKYSTP